MFLTKNFLKGFVIHLKLQHLEGTYPLILENNISSVPNVAPCSSRKMKWQQLKLMISLVFAVLLWSQVANVGETERLVTTLESTMNISAISVFIIMKAIYLKRNGLVVELVNSLLQYEKERPPELNVRRLLWAEKFIILYFQFCGHTACPLIIGAYSIQRWLNPCTSATFLWNILPECSDNAPGEKWGLNSLTNLALIIIFSAWLLADLMGGFTFQVVEVVFLQSACLVSYMKDFRNMLQDSRLRFAEKLFHYKELQILANLYNTIQKDGVIGTLFGLIVTLITICLYTLIYVGSDMSIPHLLFFTGAFMNALATNFICFGKFASLHTHSESVLEFVKRKPYAHLYFMKGKNGKKLTQRIVASLYPLKVYIGEVNFVEKLTPVILLEFCVGQVVSLLLIR
ncbi:unnamed protein product [Orchesella dallaii]|uniref:Odorant receptor n=1 Tax=Orchesella dallaii TaxID=48710 RepID=A0ABP1RV53_9HEXA